MDINSHLMNAEYYGDNTRWFIGTVVELQGTTNGVNTNRVKIRALGIHDNIPDEFLPWASTLLPTTEGGAGSGRGANLDIDAQVFGIFLDGKDSQVPVVLGSIPYVKTTFDQLNQDAAAVRDAILGGSSGQFGATGGTTDGPDGPTGITSQIPVSGEVRRYDASTAGEMAYVFFRNKGYSDAQARGIYGNLKAESSFSADIITGKRLGDTKGSHRGGTYAETGLVQVQNYKFGSYGVAQWYSPSDSAPAGRFKTLLEFAKTNKLNWQDLETQLAFIEYELQTTHSNARAQLMKCSTAGQAAVAFMRLFEIPAVQGASNCPGTKQSSKYRDPPYNPSGKVVPKRCGEDERINYAEGAVFKGVASSGGSGGR